MKSSFKKGDIVTCIDNSNLYIEDNGIPLIRKGARYIVQKTMTCHKGCCNLIDIGLSVDFTRTNCGCIITDKKWWMKAERFRLASSTMSELDKVIHFIKEELND